MDGGAGDSIVLEEEIDPNYEPTEDEVLEYAKWLGMDLEAERDLFWIAREGLKAPLPENWKPCKTTDTGEIYYFNFATGASTWDHPCDEYYRKLYDDHKKKTIQGKKFQDSDSKKKKEKEDVDEILGKKPKKKKSAPKVETLSTVKSALDKKPLGALPSKLGPTSGGLGPLGGLKPVGGLGRPGSKPLARADSDEEKDADDDDEEEAKVEIKAITKKPLLGMPPKTSNKDELDKKAASLEKELAELEAAHADKVATLRAKVEEQEEALRDAQAANEKKLAKIQDAHNDEVASMKELEKKLSKRRKDMEAENRKHLDELEETLVASKRELRQRHEKETKEIEDKHRARLEELEAKHEHALEEMRHKQEMESEHREMVRAEASNRLQDEIDGLKAELVKAKATIQRLEEDAADVEKTKQALNTKAAALEDKVRDLDGQVSTLQQELSAKPAAESGAVDDAIERESTKWKTRMDEVEASWQAKVDDATTTKEAAIEAKDQARVELQEATAALDAAKAATAIAEAECQRLQQQMQEATAAAQMPVSAPSEVELRELQAQFDALAAEHAAAKADVELWRNKFEVATAEADMPPAENPSATTALEAKCEALRAESETVKTALQAELESLSSVHASASKSWADEKAAMIATAAASQTEHDALVVSCRELEKSLASAQAAHRELQAAHEASVSASADSLQDEVERWRQKYLALESDVADIKAANATTIDGLNAAKGQLEDDLARARTETTTLREKFLDEKKQLETQLAQVQSQWTALQSQETSTSGVLGALQEQLRQALDEKAALHTSMDEQLEQLQKTSSVYEGTIATLKRDAIDAQAAHAAALQAALGDVHKVEAQKRALDDQRAALERKLKQKDAELAAVMIQVRSEPSTATSMVPAWELDKSTNLAKSLEAEKNELEKRCEAQVHEIDTLTDTLHRLQLEKDASDKKARQMEADRDAAFVKLKGLQGENDAMTTKLRAATAETTEAKAAGNKLKVVVQSLENQVLKLTNEVSQWERDATTHREAAEALELTTRTLKLQVDDLSYQLTAAVQDKTALQQEVDGLRARAATATEKAPAGGDKSAQWKQQVDTLLLEKQQVTDKVRFTSQKLQEVETKMKSSIEALERTNAALAADKQAALDKSNKWSNAHQQAEVTLRRTLQEKEELDDACKRLQQDKADIEAKVKSQTDTIQTLERQHREALLQVDSLEDAKRAMQYATQTLESKLKRCDAEIDRLKADLAAQTQAKDAVDSKLRQETAELEAKIKGLRLEAAEALQRRSTDDESTREQLQREYKREIDEARRDIQAKLNAVEKDAETMRQQLHERTKEVQLKAKELEAVSVQKQKLDVLSASVQEQARQEKAQLTTEMEGLKARLKAVQAEKDELFLLASAQSSSPSPVVAPETNNYVHSVKLQMAHVNQSELETHLKEVTSQLDTWRRKASMLDLRCRDLALELEGLHVENATLRSAAQRLHTNAMETLSTVERLNYEHKKRLLRTEYMAQLRDFTDREELALARQKARVRASCERQLEEVVLAFQHQKAQRLEHEENEFQAAMRHCQQDHELQLQRALKGYH
ncbi:glutamic acid-rich protein precursor, partial [Achlya hypogyna]